MKLIDLALTRSDVISLLQYINTYRTQSQCWHDLKAYEVFGVATSFFDRHYVTEKKCTQISSATSTVQHEN